MTGQRIWVAAGQHPGPERAAPLEGQALDRVFTDKAPDRHPAPLKHLLLLTSYEEAGPASAY